MNVNSGGPHILLFERDQQLTGLLISEFQLAGYECHTARTAVEVFDAIARFPIRLVLVNLAQAAANRREFWVALDAQRRGRGVQVLTFRCMNLAGYGPDDPDDRSRAYLTDMEVDGMLGVMNLVDAVRARVPGSPTSTTGSFARLNAQAAPGQQANLSPHAGQLTSQPAGPLASLANARSGTPTASTSPSEPGIAPRTALPTPSEKIRAVIYPGSRSYPPSPSSSARPASSPDVALRPPTGDTGSTPAIRDASVPPTLSYQQSAPPASGSSEQTGLEQLSRMVRENPPAWTTETPSSKQPAVAQAGPAPVPAPAQERPAPYKGPQTDQVNIQDVHALAANLPAPAAPVVTVEAAQGGQAQPAEPASIADLELRPSPIEDLPIERTSSRVAAPPASAAQAQTYDAPAITSPLPAVHPTPRPAVASQPEQLAPVAQVEAREEGKAAPPDYQQEQGEVEPVKAIERALVEQITELSTGQRGRANPPSTSEEVLLDIVQSLPPVAALPTPPAAPTPPPQTPVLNGRATRSLGNVLLEGHLVPQHRLEVAQNIQRMLRGVDMNYQLGEILLMFKLLTPDQLLAASLVSYGLLSAPQISGLGRIRQELHLMGLEYDLESLLILFRILTPDQLREVRASWSS